MRQPRTFYITLSFLFLLGCKGNPGTEPNTPDPSSGDTNVLWLHTEGARIVDSAGEIKILRGVNRSGLEYDKTGSGISESEIGFICKVWKAEIIRIPFNQDWVMRDPNYVSLLDRVVGWIAKQGAYALLDLQWRNTMIQIPPIPDEEAVDMWKMLAVRYRENPAVLYDIHNEAHDVPWTDWRSRASEIIEGIRLVHPDALVFVSGLDWAYDLRGWEQEPLPYPNVVYSTHPYPFKGEPWAWDKYFGNLSARLPVFAGEFGGGTADLEWGRQLLAYFDAKGLGWTAWSWVDNPRLTQDDRQTPTEFGLLVKDALAIHSGGQPHILNLWDVQVIGIDRDKATIQWRTDSSSDSKVWYGTAALTDSVYVPAMLQSHTVKLIGLSAGTSYLFRAGSRDSYGVTDVSRDSTFTTLP